MKRWILLLVLCLPIAVQTVHAQEGGAAPKVTYVTLFPSLVGNYGAGTKLQYYKADVALRVANEEAAKRVEHHAPLIRNQLVMLFAQQTDETLASLEGKERLRLEALTQIQQVLAQEEGSALVDDLLFTNLVVQ